MISLPDLLMPSRSGRDAQARQALATLSRRVSALRNAPPVPAVLLPKGPPARKSVVVGSAQKLNQASGVLAFSVLTDSALEHYRGSFRNKAMFTPLVVSALALAASVHGTADDRPDVHVARDVVFGLTAVTGLIGTAFHVYNVGSRQGGYSWLNFFYRAPIGAPMAIAISGVLGNMSERLRKTPKGTPPTLYGLDAGKALSVFTALSLAGTTGEAWLLHFRGNFQNPFMYTPITIPPASGALLADAALRGGAPRRTAARAGMIGRHGLPHARRRADDGRVAELDAERARRAADPDAAGLHRACPGRACRPRPAGGTR